MDTGICGESSKLIESYLINWTLQYIVKTQNWVSGPYEKNLGQIHLFFFSNETRQKSFLWTTDAIDCKVMTKI